MMTLELNLDDALMIRRLLRKERDKLAHSLEYGSWRQEEEDELKRAERLLEKFE